MDPDPLVWKNIFPSFAKGIELTLSQATIVGFDQGPCACRYKR